MKSNNDQGWVFNWSLARKAFKSNSITKDQKSLLYKAAFIRSDVAACYLEYYHDELNSLEREEIFNTVLKARNHALTFMKKNLYTEEERLKFQKKLIGYPTPFFKYLKVFPDLLRENEKDKFYQENKATLLNNVFRDNFNEMIKVFKNQLTIEEINEIAKHSLRTKAKRNTFFVELLNYVEDNNIILENGNNDKLLSYAMIGFLTR